MDYLGRFSARTISASNIFLTDKVDRFVSPAYDVEVFTDGDSYDEGVYVRMCPAGQYGPADSGVVFLGAHSTIAHRARQNQRTLADEIAGQGYVCVSDHALWPFDFALDQDGSMAYQRAFSIDNIRRF